MIKIPEQYTAEEIKRTTLLVNSMTELIQSTETNQQAKDNINGLKAVFEQPSKDFGAMLLNPLKEQIYASGSPLMASVAPIMETLSGAAGAAIRPVFQAIADMLVAAAPFIDAITLFVENGATALFEFEANKPGGFNLDEAIGGAAGGALAMGALTWAWNAIPVVGQIGYGLTMLAGGVFGFFFGGFF